MLIYKDCIEESEGLQYTCDPCDITEGGGVRSLCLLKKGTTIPNPYTQLDIDILVGAGLMHVMAQTRGSFDGGTPKMITGYGDNKERNIGSDYVLQVKDPTFADNYEFWEAVEKIEDWNIAFRTETQLAVVYDDVTITTKAPAEEGIDTEVVWDIECKWFSKNKPFIQPYSGKFDTILQTLDVIYGGSAGTTATVKLTVDNDKTGYIKLPNGTVLGTTAGVINTTYSGIAGKITRYVPKNNVGYISMVGSTTIGDVTYTGNKRIEFSVIAGITSFTSNTVDRVVGIGCTHLAKAVLPKSYYINLSGCILTAKSIGDILYYAHVDNRASVVFNFSGGTNANETAIAAYMLSTYNLDLSNVLEDLTSGLGGTITLNT